MCRNFERAAACTYYLKNAIGRMHILELAEEVGSQRVSMIILASIVWRTLCKVHCVHWWDLLSSRRREERFAIVENWVTALAVLLKCSGGARIKPRSQRFSARALEIDLIRAICLERISVVVSRMTVAVVAIL